MTAHVKQNNSWRNTNEMKVKVGSAAQWRNVGDGYIKVGGVWRPFFAGDNLAPPAPTLRVYNNKNESLEIAVHISGSSHLTNVRKIRVLVLGSGSVYPSNPEQSAGFYKTPAVSGGVEPFSEFFYNNQGGFTDGRRTGTWSSKIWNSSLPMAKGKRLANSRRYFITAWTQGTNGLWSTATQVGITTGKTGTAAQALQKITRIYVRPKLIGTVRISDGQFFPGSARVEPGHFGIMLYNKNTAVPKNWSVSEAGLWLLRDNDTGQPSARLDVGWQVIKEQQVLDRGLKGFNPMNSLGVRNIGTITKRAGGSSRYKSLPAASLWNGLGNAAPWYDMYALPIHTDFAIIFPFNTSQSVQSFKHLVAKEEYAHQGELRITTWNEVQVEEAKLKERRSGKGIVIVSGK